MKGLVNPQYRLIIGYEEKNKLSPGKLEIATESDVFDALFARTWVWKRLIAVAEDEVIVITSRMDAEDFFKVFDIENKELMKTVMKVASDECNSIFTKKAIASFIKAYN